MFGLTSQDGRHRGDTLKAQTADIQNLPCFWQAVNETNLRLDASESSEPPRIGVLPREVDDQGMAFVFFIALSIQERTVLCDRQDVNFQTETLPSFLAVEITL